MRSVRMEPRESKDALMVSNRCFVNVRLVLQLMFNSPSGGVVDRHALARRHCFGSIEA